MNAMPAKLMVVGTAAVAAVAMWWMNTTKAPDVSSRFGTVCVRGYADWDLAMLSPHILVDGTHEDVTDSTAIHLSPHAGPTCRPSLRSTLSAESAFAFVENPSLVSTYADVNVVTTPTFSISSLISLYILTQPKQALQRKALLLDVARASSFERCEFHDAARVLFCLRALTDPARSTLEPGLFMDSAEKRASALYTTLLPLLPHIVSDVVSLVASTYDSLWRKEDIHYQATAAAVHSGRIRFEVFPSLDLTVTTVTTHMPNLHRIPLHNFLRNQYYRMCVINGDGHYELFYRYESHIDAEGCDAHPRIPLDPLARDLNLLERKSGGDGEWVYDNQRSWDTALRLSRDGSSVVSALDKATFVRTVKAFLRSRLQPVNPLRRSVIL